MDNEDRNQLRTIKQGLRADCMARALPGSWQDFDLGDGLRGYMYEDRTTRNLMVAFDVDDPLNPPPNFENRASEFVASAQARHRLRQMTGGRGGRRRR